MGEPLWCICLCQTSLISHLLNPQKSDVKFASKIVVNARLLPALNADITDLPARSSSFIRSAVKILASTAIPTPSIKAAIPGRVNTA